MAKDQFSFDIVSEVDMQEVRNAVDQTQREFAQRFDFKGTETSISHDGTTIELRSSTEDRIKAAIQVLKEKAVKRSIPLKALSEGEVHPAAKGHVRQSVTVLTGIGDEKAKELSKFIRSIGSKVQTQIQGYQVRVTGKSKDDLQAVIRAVKERDFGIALQFTNFRP
jgi:cyclic-di-GMP-binding protein